MFSGSSSITITNSLSARCGLGGGHHHASRARQHHITFSYCPQHERICRLGWVRDSAETSAPLTLTDYYIVRRTKKKDIYVISTPKRPVPLEHYLWAGREMHKILDARGQFLGQGSVSILRFVHVLILRLGIRTLERLYVGSKTKNVRQQD